MPRSASTDAMFHWLTPARCFQLSPSQVSENFSPGRGIEWKVQTSLPVITSQARASPAGPLVGDS